MLGPLYVTIGNRPAAFRTDAERALLAYLAAQQGIPQRRDTLAALLSPDRNDSDALTYLRNRLARLRSALGGDAATSAWLEVDNKQITLHHADDIQIDASLFATRLATVECHPHRHLAGCPACLAHLRSAVDLVRGELLAGLNFPSETWQTWLVGQREHLQQRALTAMTLLRDARIERGEWATVLTVAQRQLTLEPWLEAAHRAIMTAHVQLGDRNAALAQYETCVALLENELGVEPEDETTALFEKLKYEDAKSSPATRHAPPAILDNLPHYVDRFWGRQAEKLHLLQRLVDKHTRLITLVGTGGVGKTRLAVEVGQALKASFGNGVWFVSLAAFMGDSEELAEQIKIAIGEQIKVALGLGQDDKQLTGDQVFSLLRDKQLLLILDNCEGVLDALGFLPTWLKRAPQVVMLATSRTPLNFAIEAVVTISGLAMGEEAAKGGKPGAAEAMFVERGQLARSDFAITAENLPHVRQICQLVDGLPLGIALAAAWLRRRSLAQIIEAITRSLDFLSTGLRDVDPRHRSMRAVFETSWQLLSEPEQAVLAALSVFPASFSAQAAAVVAGAALVELDQLCEKSLLQQQPEAERYTLHSLVRQFAAEKLASRRSEVDNSFIDYFYGFACDKQHEYAALQPEWGNFAAAIGKAHTQQCWQRVLDFVQVLNEPWFRQIRFAEMRTGLMFGLEAARFLDNQAVLAHTLLRLGEIEMELNHYGTAETHLKEALGQFIRLEDGSNIAYVQYFMGRIKVEQSEDEQAIQLLQESKRIFAEEGNWLGVAKNLNLLALSQIKVYGDYQTAQRILEESIALQQKSPPSPTFIEALRTLSRVKSAGGDYESAERYLGEAINLSRRGEDKGEYVALLFERTVLCRRQNQFDVGLNFGSQCLESVRSMGSLRWEALIKTQLALLHQAKKNYPQALSFLLESLQLFVEVGDVYEEAYCHFFLYRLYQAMGMTEQSEQSRQQAILLNKTLRDQELRQRLTESGSVESDSIEIGE